MYGEVFHYDCAFCRPHAGSRPALRIDTGGR
jgi:hypothetical protein